MHDKAYKHLAKYRGILSKQEIRTLRGQIKAGQADAAMKGLEALLKRRKHEKIDFTEQLDMEGNPL